MELARGNFKLWSRVEDNAMQRVTNKRFAEVIARFDKSMYPGLCEECKEGWRSYMGAFPERFAAAFPEVNLTSSRTIK